MKYIVKKAMYNHETCKECEFANKIQPCRRKNNRISIIWCMNVLGEENFPLIINENK